MSYEYMLVDDDALNDLRYRSRQAEQRRAQAEQALQAAQMRLNAAEDAVRVRLDDDRRRLQTALQTEESRISADIGRLQSSLDREMERQNGELCRQLDAVRRNLARTNARVEDAERQIKALTERFDAEFRAIAEQISGQRDRAQCCRDRLDALLRGIDRLHPEQLTPGQAEPLRDSRKFIDADIANGDHQAAIGVAQSRLPEAVSLLAELERLNGEYDRLSVSVRKSVLDIRQRMQGLLDRDANARAVRTPAGDGEFAYDGDVDFWSNGLLGQLCASFDEEQRQAEDFLADMDLKNLRTAADRLPLYLERLELCRQFADEEFLLSCGVQELAMQIYDVLAKDLELLQSGFRGNDPRRPYLEIFQDTLGYTVTIVIQADRSREPPAVFSIDACDGDHVRSEGMCRILRDAVLARLHTCGVPRTAHRQDKTSAQGQEPSQFVGRVCADEARKREERIEGVRRLIDLRS